MKNLLLLFSVLFSKPCFSQGTISIAKVKEYMDKEACVVNNVVPFKLASEGKNTNYINIENPILNVFYGGDFNQLPRKVAP